MAKQKSSRTKKRRGKEHDLLFRGAFSIRPIAAAHLRDVLSDNELQSIDLETLTLISDSYVNTELVHAIADICWRCQLINRQEILISFLFEHKSSLPDESIHIQLLQYLLGIWQLDISEKRPLTFVVPLIVYHGKSTWKVRPFWDSFPKIPDIWRQYLPEFQYILSALHDVPTDLIRAKDDLGALRSVYLAYKYAFDKNELANNFGDILIFVHGLGSPALDALLAEMIFTYVERRLDWEVDEFEQFIRTTIQNQTDMPLTIIEKYTQIGIEQGIEQGIEITTQLKNHQFVVSLLENTDWDDAKIASIADVTIEYVTTVRQQQQEATH